MSRTTLNQNKFRNPGGDIQIHYFNAEIRCLTFTARVFLVQLQKKLWLSPQKLNIFSIFLYELSASF